MLHPWFDHRYRLRTPFLTVRVEYDAGFVVSDAFSTVYGAGDDLDAALTDYARSLFDYFAKLESRESHLAPGLRRELATLRAYIAPRANPA